MSSPAVPLSESSHHILHELVQKTGIPMQEILEAAVEEYRRKVFLDEVNAGYAAMRADPQAWSDEMRSRAAWDSTLMDGLADDERWTEDGRVINADSEAGSNGLPEPR